MSADAMLIGQIPAQLEQLKHKVMEQAQARQAQLTEQRQQLIQELERRKERQLVRVLCWRDAKVLHALFGVELLVDKALETLTMLEGAAKGPAVPVRMISVGKLRLEAWKAQVAKLCERLSQPQVEGYDGLNVKQVNAQLDQLSVYDLAKLKLYEQARKNRVTILREVERRLVVYALPV